ncbi:MAG: hypothetical protein WAN03_17915, partial [Candidatus Sulfotelmatobacter sp.]
MFFHEPPAKTSASAFVRQEKTNRAGAHDQNVNINRIVYHVLRLLHLFTYFVLIELVIMRFTNA